ncbi:MAG: prepilin-type N-terminal cleavage/methylation domain-containing protein [Halioglobus sp.]
MNPQLNRWHISVGRSMSAGFTLIEVIVALSILSLVMLATVTALRTFANTQSTLDRMISRIDEVRTVSSFLRDSLDSTVFEAGGNGLSLGGYGGREAAYFAGDKQSLAWKAPILFGESFGGTFLLQLSQVESEIILRWQEPVLPGTPVEWEGTPSRVLVYDVEEFDVAFLAKFDGEWRPEWESKNGESPVLIKMNIKASERYWPELIVQVQSQ